MTNRQATLGDRVRDRVTKFTGIVVSHAKHLTGCDRLFIEPEVDKEGKRVDGMWVDIDMLDILEPNVIECIEYVVRGTKPGGYDLPPSR